MIMESEDRYSESFCKSRCEARPSESKFSKVVLSPLYPVLWAGLACFVHYYSTQITVVGFTLTTSTTTSFVVKQGSYSCCSKYVGIQVNEFNSLSKLFSTNTRARRSKTGNAEVYEGKNGYVRISPNSVAEKNTLSKTTKYRPSKKGPQKQYRRGRRPRYVVWDESYHELLDYLDEYGHCHVPQTFPPNERLGRWVARQRTFYRQWQDYQMISNKSASHSGRFSNTDSLFVNFARPISANPLAINQTRIELLDEIGFAWNVNELKWKQRLQELKEFQQKHKHCNVPVQYKHNRPLGFWVNNQRLQYKQGILSSDRIQELESVNFTWSSHLADQQWEARYKELYKFYETCGHVNVPEKYEPNQGLAYWVTSQRKQYRKMQQRGFSMIDSLKRIQNSDHEEDENEDEDDLSSSTPKTSKPRSPILTTERIDKLNRLGFVWNIFDARWKERFDMLIDFKREHGHCLVPAFYEENKELACWVLNQRTQYRYYRNGESSGLSKVRIDALEDLGFVWHDHQNTWEKMCSRLGDYIQAHPEANSFIPPSDLENRPLRIWAKNQRYDYRKMSDPTNYSPMTPHRVEALNKIGFQWVYQSKRLNGPSTQEWSVLFDKLREKGIAPEAKAKTHWFDGATRPVADEWNIDVYKLWNEDGDEADIE